MKTRIHRGFTLIELLVVITIIMLLAGMLLGSLYKAKEQAKRASAREDISQLVTAFKSYLNDYRRFPQTNISVTDSNVVALLRGQDPAFNPENIQYMEFKTNEIVNGFRDPWGGLYQVALDNGMGTNDWTGGAHDGWIWPRGTNVELEVGAWSKGPDGLDGTEEEWKDDIVSW